MSAPTADELQRAWVAEELWQELEEAQDALTSFTKAAYAESGGRPAVATEVLERRARPGTRLEWALRRVCLYEHMMAYILNEGWEPAPDALPGVMQRRPGGPLPLAERRHVADALGVPLELLEDEEG